MEGWQGGISIEFAAKRDASFIERFGSLSTLTSGSLPVCRPRQRVLSSSPSNLRRAINDRFLRAKTQEAAELPILMP
jgi:hypothetical protein